MPYKDKEQMRAYQRQWIADRRAQFFDGKACECGSTDRLELDHIDPTKKVSHKIWSWSAAKREAELVKCQVLCYDCHKKKSIEANLKRFCVNGHDTHVVGRKTRSGGGCRACAQDYDRRRRSL